MAIELTEEEKKLAKLNAQKAGAAEIASILGSSQRKETGPTGNHVNDIIAAKKKTGAGVVAGTTGTRAAQGFAAGGPVGAAVGGGIGLIEGIAGSQRAKRDAKVAEKRSLADIEEKKQNGLNGNIQAMIEGLRQIL